MTAFDYNGERVVLLFNETPKPVNATLTVRNAPAGTRAYFNDSATPLDGEGPYRLNLPRMDVGVVHYR